MVTGAAGFIGSHLVDRLLEAGYEVTGLDCFTEYYSEDAKRRNLSRALSHERFQFLKGDILGLDPGALLSGVDKVAHLAGEPGVRPSWGERFSIYLERNARTTQHLLEAVSRGEPKHFVYASSSSVYGPDGGGPVAEDYQRCPASPYGVSKLAAEELVGLYARERGVPATVLRYFTVYGPRQRPEMALVRFISAALEGRSVEIFGDGGQSREMTYVSDVVDATVAALEQGGQTAPLATPRTYNVGGGARTTVNGMLDAVQRATGERIEAVYTAAAEGDVRSTWADSGRAHGELGYRPRVSLEEGVALQVEWALRRTPVPV